MAMSAAYQSLKQRVTVEEYLKFEETAETKHEYADGEIIAMAGTSSQHNEVAGNVYIEMQTAFRNRNCRAYIADIRVRVSVRRYLYPDVIAVCGAPEFDDSKPPCLLNPQVLVEVLSASTESIDFVVKQNEYRRFASVTDYILIAQDRYWVMHYVRQPDGSWKDALYTEPEEVLNIASIGVRMTLDAIYRKVEPLIPPETLGDDVAEANGVETGR